MMYMSYLLTFKQNQAFGGRVRISVYRKNHRRDIDLLGLTKSINPCMIV